MKNLLGKVVLMIIVTFIISLLVYIYIVPWLYSSSWFLEHTPLKDTKKTVIINKTEKITVKEVFSLRRTSQKALPGVVDIYYIPKKNKKTIIKQNIVHNSGAIVTGDGVVVTVLPEIKLKDYSIKIFLSNNEEYVPSALSKDYFNGLLFLKIVGDNLPVIPFGHSDSLKNGEKLILLGKANFSDEYIFALRTIERYSNSFNKDNLSFVFSDKNTRAIILNQGVSNNFQSSLAVDFNGTVVGIVKRTKNVSYVIPLENIQQRLQKDIFDNEILKSPNLGVYYINLNPRISKLNNFTTENGALIYIPSEENGLAIIANAMGKKYGLKIGDTILKVNDDQLNCNNSLSWLLFKHMNDENLRLQVLRDGVEKTIEIKQKDNVQDQQTLKYSNNIYH